MNTTFSSVISSSRLRFRGLCFTAAAREETLDDNTYEDMWLISTSSLVFFFFFCVELVGYLRIPNI